MGVQDAEVPQAQPQCIPRGYQHPVVQRKEDEQGGKNKKFLQPDVLYHVFTYPKHIIITSKEKHTFRIIQL